MNALKEQVDTLGIATIAARDILPVDAVDALRDFAVGFSQSERVDQEAKKFAEGGQRNTVKQWMVKYQEKQEFTRDHPLYRAGTLLLSHVRNLLGPCRYVSADLWYALPGAEQRGREWSQNWHRDPEGPTLIKAMLFINDVDEESGPFEFVPESHLKYFDICPAGHYTNAMIPQENVLTVLCPAETLAFVNTSGLHRGGATRSKPRLSATWTYVPANNPMSPKFSVN